MDDILIRLKRAYNFLRDEGHFVTADACLTAYATIETLRSDLQSATEAQRSKPMWVGLYNDACERMKNGG